MKTILLGAGLLAWLNLAQAQVLMPEMNTNGPIPSIANAFDGIQINGVSLNLTSVADVETMLEALQSGPPVSVDSLPPRPVFNGCWSLQHPYDPPLPGNTLGVNLWPLGNGNAILDDWLVDYDALDAPPMAFGSPMTRMSMMASSLASSYAYGNAVYLTNMKASLATDGSVSASFGIGGGTNFVPYDILMSTNLTFSAPDWNWIGIGYTSNNYTFYEQPASLAFYRLAKPSSTMTVGFGGAEVGQCDVPYGLTNAIQVAGGAGHSLALLNDGTVAAWGWNPYGQATVPTNLTGVAMVAAGWYHSAALLTNGTVTAWGLRDNELFDGLDVTNVPAGLTNATVISAQALHTLALTSNGTVVAWGYGEDGEASVPAGLTNVTAIAAGYEFNLVVSNGTVVAWGNNLYGQTTVPTGLSNVVDVAAGLFHSLALLNNGTVVAWGDNTFGEAGVPAGLSNVVAIAASGDIDDYDFPAVAYSMALKSDGTLVVWGDDFAVDPVGGLNHVIAIAAGNDTALAIRTGPPTPVITLEPTNEYQLPDGTVTFTTSGAGLYGVTYQWQTNGVNIIGATNTTLTESDLEAAQWNIYDVVVTDNAGMGSIVSSNANLYSVTPPVIISQSPMPTNQVAIYQSNVVLSVMATAPGANNGSPLSYQWQFNGTNLAGATTAAYTVHTGPNSFGMYSVLVSNTAGSTNAAWQLTVYYPGLLISQQPANQYQIAGGEVTFVGSAVASNAMTYQWAFNGTNIAGATNGALTLTNVQAAQQGWYNFNVSDGSGSLTSSNAYFTLVTPPLLTSEATPAYQIAAPYGFFTLNVAATAPGITNGFPLSYQWQLNGINLPGQTSSNYTFAALNSGMYSVLVNNAAGSTNVSWQLDVPTPGNTCGWGENEYGQSAAPSGITNIVALATGDYHSVGVEDNGTVVQWGYNIGDPADNLTNAVGVAMGYGYCLALRGDGTVETWGTNNPWANYVPSGLSGVTAVAAGWYDNVVLLTNGTVEAWGLDGTIFDWGDLTDVTGLTNITAISAQGYHALALTSSGTVLAWGDDREGESDVPTGLSNVVAVAAGEEHSLALLSNGTVVAWGFDDAGQCDVPLGLSNVMALAAGAEHSVALLNNGTVVCWGDNSDGQTNTPALNQVKLIAAGGNHTLATIFSPLVMYPVNVAQDLLLIYNTNSTDSATVLNYYLANRQGVRAANVLGIGFPGIYITNASGSGFVSVTNTYVYETITYSGFTNEILAPMQAWLNNNPTKRPQYVMLFLDVPSRVDDSATTASNFPYYDVYYHDSVGDQLATVFGSWSPFVTHLNMNGTNDCIAYINKLHYIGANFSPGRVVLSASTGGYGNTNYYFDDANNLYSYYTPGLLASDGVVQAGVSPACVTYTNVPIFPDECLCNHITNGFNLSGYLSWGGHSQLNITYAEGEIRWTGNNGCYLIETIESYNGQRYTTLLGSFVNWFASDAFGGTNYSNTPIAGVSSVDEPYSIGASNPQSYFGLWAAGKDFAICAWVAKQSAYFQAVGDPFVTR